MPKNRSEDGTLLNCEVWLPTVKLAHHLPRNRHPSVTLSAACSRPPQERRMTDFPQFTSLSVAIFAAMVLAIAASIYLMV